MLFGTSSETAFELYFALDAFPEKYLSRGDSQVHVIHYMNGRNIDFYIILEHSSDFDLRSSCS